MFLTVWQRVDSSARLRTLATYGTLCLLVLSVGLNVALSRRLMAFVQPDEGASMTGEVAPPLAAVTLSGDPAQVSFDGRPTILYYFSPNCSWCEQNWTNVKALVASVSDKYRFVGLSSVPDVSTYVNSHHLAFEVYSGLALETARLYHLGGTPQTVVVGADGRIRYVWHGAYRGRLQREIESALGIVLPGVASSPTH